MKAFAIKVMLPSGRTASTVVYAESSQAADEIAIMLFTSSKVLSKAIEVVL
ncbi:hypothetical protein AU106_gp013 [Sinorhizobium phage phiM9]|uniref:Uncharacterized protein n=1 Tax=Sinorhizobium phage phiM9 TaxID=1636182 RepID=A0A0F6THE2_9CAUD|nr:hypothetical protein AU106_gp013 [Sinorhizobium phage phiM9]AKE44644.1 hypothetical protein Sm_phiM9_014 [Sinorhizobium phage phiM9]